VTTAASADQVKAGPREGQLDRLRLRFLDAELEREFVTEDDRDAIPQMRIAGVLAVVLFGGFGLLDHLVVEGSIVPILVIRFGVVCPVVLVALALIGRPVGRRLAQPLVCGVVLVGCGGLNAMPLVADVPSDYARTGTLLVLMFLDAFARVRFPWATATTVLIVAGYVGAAIFDGVAAGDLAYNSFFLIGFVVIGSTTSYALDRLRRAAFLRERALERERRRSELLLHNVLPPSVAQRLQDLDSTFAEAAEDVTVLFADIVGFTPLAETLDPTELVGHLHELFTRFDEQCDAHGAEKIKTIGDAYMAVAGVPSVHPDHAAAVADLALGMREVADTYTGWPGGLALRIGVASGPVVAGVIGTRKFLFDLWGDTVNTASRLESSSLPGEILISSGTRLLLGDRFETSAVSEVTVKGHAPVPAHLLIGRSSEGAREPVSGG
jgi:class 3 adenylate cyclase